MYRCLLAINRRCEFTILVCESPADGSSGRLTIYGLTQILIKEAILLLASDILKAKKVMIYEIQSLVCSRDIDRVIHSNPWWVSNP